MIEKKAVRVLQVFSKMNRGGAETIIMNLYRNIDRSIIQFDFVVHTEEVCDYDEEIISMGGRIFRVPKYLGVNHFEYIRSWENLFNNNPELKIIHAHVRSTASLFLNVAKKKGITTIAHSHNTSSGKGMSAIVKNVLQYPIRYIADYFFSCSNLAGEWLFGKNIVSQDNYFLMKNAVNLKQFSYNISLRNKVRQELGLEDKFIIGHIGRFHPQKNHDFIIDIFSEVHLADSNSVLILVGTGGLKKSIEDKVKSLGLSDHVFFMGVSNRINELLQIMDVFLFPSLHEGLPVVLVEAQATGLPCILSTNITDEVDVVKELINREKLDNSGHIWATKVLEMKNKINERKNTSKKLIEAGYDIEETSKWYTKFILNEIGHE